MKQHLPDFAAAHDWTLHPAPALPERVVRRPRLLELFDDVIAVDAHIVLTMVVAPAGAGKTVLASQWVQGGQSQGVWWLATSAHERLPAVLLAAAGLPEAALTETGAPNDEASEHARLLEMLRAAAATRSRPGVVVVDDAHQLPGRQVRLLARILAGVPEAVRLVLLSRRALAMPLVSLELAGRLRTVCAGHLRFRDDEARELVVTHAPRATTADLTVLQQRTRGWAAALILGAHTLHTAEDPEAARALMESTDQPVLDYLLADALDALPPETLQVLQVCCGEAELTAESVEALVGRADAVDQLAALSRDGLLVSAFPGRGSTGPDGRHSRGTMWSLHPLLLEYLRRRARRSAEAELTSEAHVRGARHARAGGDPAGAVRHSVLSGDTDLLCEMVIDVGPDLVVGGEHQVLLGALTEIPIAYRQRLPSISAVHALLCRAVGDIPNAMRLAEEARRAFHSVGAEAPGRARVHEVDVVALELWRARYGWTDAGAAVRAARAVQEEGPAPGSERGLRAPTGVSAVRACGFLLELAATETWLDNVHAAADHVTAALVLARAARSSRLTPACLALQAVLTLTQGRAAAAAALANEALTLRGDEPESDDVDTSRARTALAWASFYALDFESAQRRLDEVRRADAAAYDPLTVILAVVLRSRLLIEQGRIDDAERVLSMPLAVPRPVPRFVSGLISFTKAHLAAITGSDVDLRKEIQILRDLGCADAAALYEAIDDAHQGYLDEAVAQLTELTARAPTDRVVRAAAETIRLILLLLSHREDEATAALPHVLGVMAQDRLLHVLSAAVPVEESLTQLLFNEVQRPDAHPTAVTALAAIRSYQRAYHPRHRPEMSASTYTSGSPDEKDAAGVGDGVGVDHHRPVPGLQPLLTPRELAVVQQLALGGSYGDVASSLYVTVNTVKTHVASVYRKLGVVRKAEALQVARDLGLIGMPEERPGFVHRAVRTDADAQGPTRPASTVRFDRIAADRGSGATGRPGSARPTRVQQPAG